MKPATNAYLSAKNSRWFIIRFFPSTFLIVFFIPMILLGLGTFAGECRADLQLDPFLGVYLIDTSLADQGDDVDIDGTGTINTNTTGAHGIYADSSSPGYSTEVISNLENFDESVFTFSVTQVRDAEGVALDLDADDAVEVRGYLIDANGDKILDGDDNVIEHGTFILRREGTFEFSFTVDEETLHDALVDDEFYMVAVDYTVTGEREGVFQADDGILIVYVHRSESDTSLIEKRPDAAYDTFGFSAKPSDETNPTVFPDLKRYVEDMLAIASVGGPAGGVTVRSTATIETHGEKSHGIYARSQGGTGDAGRNAYLLHRSPTAGRPGKNPDDVIVFANGSIVTHANESAGIMAISAGGAGGKGGDGNGAYWGRTGGTGATGSAVYIGGGANINTSGNYSSGIVALSVGGDGGRGGSASGAMGGGDGGIGGKGGNVRVDGGWNITTAGDMAHGIWAKSLGGNAGAGGDGGWLWGDPGEGGEATDGGSVMLYSRGHIQTAGETSYGLYAQSVGGFGGPGGSSWGLFWSFGGDGRSGGSGGSVDLWNLAGGTVTTTGDYSHAMFAQSIGGGGGSGGGEFALIASLGGEGAAGGLGGYVHVENDGLLETSGIGAHGIFAQSIGGGGGDGGSVGGLVAIGGSGSRTSDGGDVDVINRGAIITEGLYSHGIFAESIGGGGGSGGRSAGLISIGGSGGGGGDAGIVSVTNEGDIYTIADESYGIFAQSIGGGGGSGGGAISAGVSIGGSGAGGGDGGNVSVDNPETGSVTTEGDRSYGIFAQSVGGGGGDGGFAITAGSRLSVAVGGNAARGGDAGSVDVAMDGSVITFGEEAYGIFAQSVGGGGGAGGFSIAASLGSGLSLSLGGSGGGGGLGDAVNVDIGGFINTYGLRAHGVLAQSVGGGGGDGGFAIAGSIGGVGTNLNLAFGGSGGSGNRGGDVAVAGNSRIATANDEAHGIFAQSVGGSGGAGGFTVSASVGGGGTRLNLGFGGDGGSGASAGNVSVGTAGEYFQGRITTQGQRSYGILAQSVGGGGGAGGASFSGSLGAGTTISMGFGGDGGSGGIGEAVDVYNAATVSTSGAQSHAILAQSVGGGGGAGGLSIAGGATAFGGLTFAIGGDGGSGNDAGDVTVSNSGLIETLGEYSYGIFAQSVGGGGGAGGSSGAVMMNYSSLIPLPPQIPEISVNVAFSLGGQGGEGGLAGRVEVDNSGAILTDGDHSYGILAQSVGGGGGDGGKSISATANISVPGEIDAQPSLAVDFAMAIGGDGGDGNHGGEVEVFNSGVIDTAGIGAHGIFAQSVGGGGGSGADARSMILSIDPSHWLPGEPVPDPTAFSFGATLSMGGSGGAGSHGGAVEVTNEGTIITRGADAFGILAQSVGGGGGVGGSGYHGLDLQDFGVPEEYTELVEFILPVQDDSDVNITVGGSGGSGGDGSDVTVTNEGDIFTLGHGSVAVLAQSVGGGGGLAGIGATGGNGSVGLGSDGGAGGDGGDVTIDLLGGIYTSGIAAHGVFAQSVGGGGGYAGNVDRGIADFGLNFAMSGGGGDGGHGGDIFINSAGDIVTEGRGAVGIFAQSVGGGGGLGGGIGFGFGFAGSVGDAGDGGSVEVDHTGNITTYGDYAHGIVAQSVGGADYGGDVVVRINGDITVHGEGALAVIAQSEGSAGRRNIDVTYAGGTVTGNSASAVRFLDGADNTLTNHGVVTTHGGPDGMAILAGSGNDNIHNYGTMIGSVDLGSGINSFTNHAGGFLDTGPSINLGADNTLNNTGTLSPGGDGRVEISSLTGNLIQHAQGLLAIDVDIQQGQADNLAVSGTALMSGRVRVEAVNKGYARPGDFNIPIVTADDGLSTSELSLIQRQSAVVNYLLDTTHDSSMNIQYDVNFSHPDLNSQQNLIGQYINAIQNAGGSETFAPMAEALIDLPEVAALGSAYNQLSPETHLGPGVATLAANQQFSNAMLSCQPFSGPQRFTTEIDCSWFRISGREFTVSRQTQTLGFREQALGFSGGLQREASENFHIGAALSYERSRLRSRNLLKTDGDRFMAGIMFKRRHEATMASLGTSFGYGDYSTTRYLNLPEPGTRATSSQDMLFLSLRGRLAHTVEKNNWYVRPMIDAGWTYSYFDSFKERGAGGANLAVRRRRENYFNINPALEIGGEIQNQKDTLSRVYARVGVIHYLGRTKPEITARMEGAPVGVDPLKITGDMNRTYLDLNFGINILQRDKMGFRLEYSPQLARNSRMHSGFFKLTIPF